MENEVEQLAKTLFINALSNATNLGSVPEDKLKNDLKLVTKICFVAAQTFYDVAKDENNAIPAH